ncbi:MAG: 2-dehydropantoate 2-reductase [Chloroflexi bacterium]|nr:MAG: 2-dehydropantoate 2-reductase [Chloroflexota bacterium]
MRYAVLGAGGLGGLVGGALARAGHSVTLVVRDPAHPATLLVESAVLGNFEVAVAVTTVLKEPVDVLWATTKATQLEGALASAPAALVEGTVVPLLNGIDHVERLREVYRAVTPGTIRVESERVAPGLIRQPGPFIAVDLAGPLATEIAAELSAAGIQARVREDETSMLWQKLLVLAPMALTTTATQRSIGGVRDDPQWRERLLGVLEEAGEVARAEGAVLDVEASRAAILSMPDGMRSSMQKDRAAGRPLELDAIAGPILRGGREHDLPTPHTQVLCSLLAE